MGTSMYGASCFYHQEASGASDLDNNYFNALYQGIPVGGYTKMVANLLDGIEVRLNEDYLEKKSSTMQWRRR